MNNRMWELSAWLAGWFGGILMATNPDIWAKILFGVLALGIHILATSKIED